MTMRPALPLIALILLSACQRETPPAPVPAPPAESVAADKPRDEHGTALQPALVVQTVDGQRYDLAERRGRWVVVNFWATWCAPCLKEMPELSALDAMREHIDVIGLAYEEIEPADMQAFLQQRPVAYPVAIVDVYDPPADFATPRGLPMTYLIDPHGRVARTFAGPVTAKELEAAIAGAGGPPVQG